MTTAEWVGAFSAVAALIAAVAAAVSAKASRDTARTLKAEHDEDRRRLELEPLMELHAALEEFVTNIVESAEGSPDANRLHRRVVAIVAYRQLPNVPLDKTTDFIGQGVGTVQAAAKALEEIATPSNPSEIWMREDNGQLRPDELERRLQARLDALGPAPRAELLHVLMLPDFERADRIGEFWGYPQSRAFAELLIDCEEDRTLRAVLVGILREADTGSGFKD